MKNNNKNKWFTEKQQNFKNLNLIIKEIRILSF